MKSTSLLLAALLSQALGPSQLHGQQFSDNFDDNSVNPEHWGDTLVEGSGRLSEQNSRVEYIVHAPDGDFDQAVRSWTSPLPVDKDWETTLLTGMDVNLAGDFPNVSIGLAFHHPTDLEKFLYIEQLSERGFQGFLSSMSGGSDNEGLTSHLGVTQGAVKLSYDAATKVITAYYDRDGAAAGFSWQSLASYGLAGSGGITDNANWDLAGVGGFRLAIEAFSERLSVSSNSVWADDFRVTIFEEAPRVSIGLTGSSIVVSWPAGGAGGFSLHMKASLTDPTWVAVASQAVQVGDTYQVTLPIGTVNQFFQLIKGTSGPEVRNAQI